MTRYQRVNATESEVNPVVAVIRFFRAFDYFDKIKTFGDVPWYEKDLTTADIDELYKARDDRDFVLGKIIEDLEFAIEWLPEKSAAEVGALHKDAARTFLARVCYIMEHIKSIIMFQHHLHLRNYYKKRRLLPKR